MRADGRLDVRRRRTTRRPLVLLVTVAASLAAIATARGAEAPMADAPPAPVVRYDDGRLTVRLEAAPLEEVLVALRDETGAEVARGEVPDGLALTARFDDVALPAALKRLFGTRSFILTYDGDGKPRRIELFTEGPHPARPRTTKPSLGDLLAQGPLVDVPPSLRPLLRRPRVRLARLMRVAGRHANQAIRNAAWRVALHTLERDPRLLDAIRYTPPEVLARLARGWVGTYAGELLDRLGSGARDPLVRFKAAKARQEIAGAAGAQG